MHGDLLIAIAAVDDEVLAISSLAAEYGGYATVDLQTAWQVNVGQSAVVMHAGGPHPFGRGAGGIVVADGRCGGFRGQALHGTAASVLGCRIRRSGIGKTHAILHAGLAGLLQRAPALADDLEVEQIGALAGADVHVGVRLRALGLDVEHVVTTHQVPGRAEPGTEIAHLL